MAKLTKYQLRITAMTNEHDAMQSLAASAEQAKQDYVADRNAATRADEDLAKKAANEIFWRGVVRCITQMTLLSLVAYALFHFA